jgi:hypothetical protein
MDFHVPTSFASGPKSIPLMVEWSANTGVETAVAIASAKTFFMTASLYFYY